MSKHHTKHGLKGGKYERFRRAMLRRAGYRCECCGKAGRLELHHIERLEDGGAAWDPENCQILTRACHLEVTRKENEQRNPTPPEVKAWQHFIKSAFDKS